MQVATAWMSLEVSGQQAEVVCCLMPHLRLVHEKFKNFTLLLSSA